MPDSTLSKRSLKGEDCMFDARQCQELTLDSLMAASGMPTEPYTPGGSVPGLMEAKVKYHRLLGEDRKPAALGRLFALKGTTNDDQLAEMSPGLLALRQEMHATDAGIQSGKLTPTTIGGQMVTRDRDLVYQVQTPFGIGGEIIAEIGRLKRGSMDASSKASVDRLTRLGIMVDAQIWDTMQYREYRVLEVMQSCGVDCARLANCFFLDKHCC